MTIKPNSHLQVGEWQYLPEQDKLVQFGPDGKVAVTAELDNLSQKVANYFIVKAGKLVTKDELLQDVWGIRDVSDGRVTRVIRVLRVALGDDTREPRYIETIPKRGYRFIAPVSEVVVEQTAEPKDHLPNEIIAAPAIKKTSFFLGALILLVAFFLSWMFWPQPAENSAAEVPMLRYSPLTSLDGLEFYQNISNDERYLVYSYASPSSDNITVLMLEDIVANKRVQLTDETYSSLGASFSPDGSKIAYQRLSVGNKCEIRLISLDKSSFSVIDDSLLTTCGLKSVSSRTSWSPDSRFLVYPEIRDGEKQLTLTLLTIDSGAKEKLTVPPVSSFGDYSARFSRKGDKIAFLREAAGVPHIWVMELGSRSSALITKVIEAYPGNVDWTLDDNGIVYPSSGNTVSKVNLSGKSTLIAYTDISASEIQVTNSGKIVASIGNFSRISPRRISNSLKASELVKETIFNSNRNETLIEANPTSRGPLAIVSQRSGLSQIWLIYPNQKQVQLTNFTEQERIRNIRFSPDGNKLLVQMVQSVMVYDLDGSYKEIAASEGAIIGVPAWSRGGKSIFYPEVSQGKWFIFEVELAELDKKVQVAAEKEFYFESYYDETVFWRDSNSKKFYIKIADAEPKEIDFELPTSQILIKFQLTKSGIYFVRLVSDLKYGLFHYDFATGKMSTVIQEMTVDRFSVSSDENFIYILEYELADMDIGLLSLPVGNL